MATYEIQVEKLTQDISQPQELRWRVLELVSGATSTIANPGTYFLLQEGSIQGNESTDCSTINKQCEDDAVGWLYNHDRNCSGNFGIYGWNDNTSYLQP